MHVGPRAVTFQSTHCTLSVSRPTAGVALVVITGSDIGQFGREPFVNLERELDAAPLRLFIDARDVRGAALEVSAEWAAWLERMKPSLRSIDMLTGSKFVRITAEFVKSYAALGELMCVYTSAAAFDEAYAAALAASS